MKKYKTLYLFLLLVAGVCCSSSTVYPFEPLPNCEGLSGLTLPGGSITVAQAVSSGSFAPVPGQSIANLPAFCEVHGILKPSPASAIHFELWMPVSGWNNELEGLGNGGLAGTISHGPMGIALRQGFAAVSTDTGHDAKESAVWLEDSDRLIDYSYRGLHLATVAAKRVVDAIMAKAPNVLTTSVVLPEGSKS